MSVIVKDIEMPKCCFECPFDITWSHGAAWYCAASNTCRPISENGRKTNRQIWCPLTEVEEK